MQRPPQLGRKHHPNKTNPAHRPSGRPARPFELERNRPDVQPVSAARLAAEAAFSSPQFSLSPNSQAQITVKRARALGQTDAQAATAHATDGANTPDPKAPRVFRIATARDTKTVAADPTPESWLGAGFSERPSPIKRRKKRLDAVQRPGPVVVVLQQPAAKAPKPSSQAFLPSAIAGTHNAATPLAAMREARSFVFIDDTMAVQWQRLSQQAETLLQQVRKLGR